MESYSSRVGYAEDGSLDALSRKVDESLRSACSSLPRMSAKRHNPWISTATLQLIEQRNDARRLCMAKETEARLNKAIRQSAKNDRKNWLNDSLCRGD